MFICWSFRRLRCAMYNQTIHPMECKQLIQQHKQTRPNEAINLALRLHYLRALAA